MFQLDAYICTSYRSNDQRSLVGRQQGLYGGSRKLEIAFSSLSPAILLSNMAGKAGFSWEAAGQYPQLTSTPIWLSTVAIVVLSQFSQEHIGRVSAKGPSVPSRS